MQARPNQPQSRLLSASPCVILKATHVGVGWVWLARLVLGASPARVVFPILYSNVCRNQTYTYLGRGIPGAGDVRTDLHPAVTLLCCHMMIVFTPQSSNCRFKVHLCPSPHTGDRRCGMERLSFHPSPIPCGTALIGHVTSCTTLTAYG